jgi:hypothetical protein
MSKNVANWLRCVPAGLVKTAWLAPYWVIAATTLVAAIESGAGTSRGVIAFSGAILGSLLWLVSALAVAPLSTAERANPRSYGELANRLVRYRESQRSLSMGADGPVMAACNEADAHLTAICNDLTSVGLKWFGGNGYLTAWEHLHRAEEALLGAEGAEGLLHETIHDELRVVDSNIPSKAELLRLLSAVKKKVDAGAALDSNIQRRGLPLKLLCAVRKQMGAAAALSPPELAQARATMKEVRCSVNEYRDSRWNGLLQLRLQTMAALLLTEYAALALVALAYFSGATSQALGAVFGLFVVGAAVGLFYHVWEQSKAEAAVEDYGLSMARLITVPVFSGLAGVGGVLISSLSAQHLPQSLSELFNLQSKPTSLLTAAVFGATPGLFVGRLARSSERYKTDIQSTEVARAGSNEGT